MRSVFARDAEMNGHISIFQHLRIDRSDGNLHIRKSHRNGGDDTDSILKYDLQARLIRRGLILFGDLPLRLYPAVKIFFSSALRNVSAIRFVNGYAKAARNESDDAIAR